MDGTHSNGHSNGTNGKSTLGLLWSKDPGSQFPFTEIQRACARFSQRSDFRGWKPTKVYIHPDHADLLKQPPEGISLPDDITLEFNDKVAHFYIIVKGEPGVVEEDLFDDLGEDITDFDGEITDFDNEILVFGGTNLEKELTDERF